MRYAQPRPVPKRAAHAAAQALGRLGARVRMVKLTPEQRREIARKAAQARWAKAKKPIKQRTRKGGGNGKT